MGIYRDCSASYGDSIHRDCSASTNKHYFIKHVMELIGIVEHQNLNQTYGKIVET
jgi:hypothetical protein